MTNLDSPNAMRMHETEQPAVIRSLAPNRAVRLRNITCPYCGGTLVDENTSLEHVVGRSFVPKGSLAGCWNLILNACERCNAEKADLEDDISAITMLPDVSGRYGHDDGGAMREAARKAKRSRSRKTGKPVGESHETINIRAQLAPGFEMSVQLTGLPLIDDSRVFELARMQLSAFFYWQTYSQTTGRGGFWLNGFHPAQTAIRSDWGNVVMRGFMQAVSGWNTRLVCNTAQGFFRLVTRKHPEVDTWAWAIEWNRSRRVVGFFGEREEAESLVNAIPVPGMRVVSRTENEMLSMREDIALSDADDVLFDAPEVI